MDKGDANHGQRLWWGLGLALTAGVVAGLTGWRRWKASQNSPLIRKGEHLSALVTGASSGIGRAYATKLAAQGYDVILVARRLERLTSLAQTLSNRYGVAATVVSADLATDDGISRVESVIEDTEHLNLLVNNAGFGLVGDFAQSDIERHLEMLHVHVHAVVRLTRAALPMLLAQNRGAVINVSSLMAYYPMYGSTTYAGTKCYLRAFTEALHQELIGTGVRVQSLCPGFVHTEFTDSAEIQQLDLPEILWMQPESVVARSLRDLRHGRVISVPGLGYRLLATAAGIIPRQLIYLVGYLFGRARAR